MLEVVPKGFEGWVGFHGSIVSDDKSDRDSQRGCGRGYVSLTWRRWQATHGLGLCLRLVPAPPTLSATNLNMTLKETLQARLPFSCVKADLRGPGRSC